MLEFSRKGNVVIKELDKGIPDVRNKMDDTADENFGYFMEICETNTIMFHD